MVIKLIISCLMVSGGQGRTNTGILIPSHTLDSEQVEERTERKSSGGCTWKWQFYEVSVKFSHHYLEFVEN